MGVRIIGLDRAFSGASERLKQAAVAAVTVMATEEERFIKAAMEADGTKFDGNTAKSVRAPPGKLVAPGVARSECTVSAQQLIPALILEEGRKPGKPVSRDGRKRLVRWARRKAEGMVADLANEIRAARARRKGKKRKDGKRAVPVQQAAEQQAAFLIARAIRRRGIPKPHRYFKRAAQYVSTRSMAIYRDVLSKLPRTGGAR